LVNQALTLMEQRPIQVEISISTAKNKQILSILCLEAEVRMEVLAVQHLADEDKQKRIAFN